MNVTRPEKPRTVQSAARLFAFVITLCFMAVTARVEGSGPGAETLIDKSELDRIAARIGALTMGLPGITYSEYRSTSLSGDYASYLLQHGNEVPVAYLDPDFRATVDAELGSFQRRLDSMARNASLHLAPRIDTERARIERYREFGKEFGNFVGGAAGGMFGGLCAKVGGVLGPALALLCGGVGGYYGAKYGGQTGDMAAEEVGKIANRLLKE